MATIRKRKNNDGTWSYNVQIRLKGFKPLAKNWPTLYEAKRWAAQTETEMREGRYFNKAETQHTLAEAIDKFVATISGINQSKHDKDTCCHLQYWRNAVIPSTKRVLGDYLLREIEPCTIEDQQEVLLNTISLHTKRLLSPTTVRHMVLSLSRLFKYILDKHTNAPWITLNVMKSVKIIAPTEGRKRYLKTIQDDDVDELVRFLGACKEVVEFRRRNKTLKRSPGSLYLYSIVYLALLTGVRSGEIKALKWCDVSLNAGTLRLYDTKNGESYTISLPIEGIELLREHTIHRRVDSLYVFPSRNGKKSIDWRRPFIEALQFANIDDFKFHDTRHTFCSYLTMGGAPDAVVQTAARHKSRQSTVRYQHVSSKVGKSAIQNMVNARLKIDKVA